jgi:hypothetical protein
MDRVASVIGGGSIEPDCIGAGGYKVDLIVHPRAAGQFGGVIEAAPIRLDLEVTIAAIAREGGAGVPAMAVGGALLEVFGVYNHLAVFFLESIF